MSEQNTSIPVTDTLFIKKVKGWNTDDLIEYLQREKDLQLDDNDFTILRKEKISGRTFLKTSKEEFRSIGLALGLASDLVDMAKKLESWKLLGDYLRKHTD